MAAPNYRKRRIHAAVNKNDLKVSSQESERKQLASAGTLRSRFPQVRALRIEYRMEATTGAILDQADRAIGLDEPLLLNVPCPGGCSGGVFALADAINATLASDQENREGMG